MRNWRKALGAAAILCALAAISGNLAHADGGPAQYRWVDSCNSTFGPTDVASSSTVTVDKRGNLCTVVASGGGGGGAVTQGTIPWQSSIVDATGATTMAVKPASTAALATDPAAAIRECDGCNVTFGAQGDAAQTDWTVTASYMSYFRGLLHVAQNPIACLTATLFNTNAYSTGLTEPINCNLNGGLYTQDRATGATGAAAPANAIQQGALTGDATTGGHLKAPITCDNHVFKHITTATDTLAVQGVASQTIYICGWRSRAAGTATWFLENTASVNANCSSSLTQITGVASEVANSGETILAAYWTGLKNTAANGLCINSTGTGGVDVDLWYTQF